MNFHAVSCQAHCIHGTCTSSPFECDCDDGWEGVRCQQGFTYDYNYNMCLKLSSLTISFIQHHVIPVARMVDTVSFLTFVCV